MNALLKPFWICMAVHYFASVEQPMNFMAEYTSDVQMIKQSETMSIKVHRHCLILNKFNELMKH